MNFDEIENLTEEQVNELYDDILLNNEKLSVCVCGSCSAHRQQGYTGDQCAPVPPLHDVEPCNSKCASLGCNVVTYRSLCLDGYYDSYNRTACGSTYTYYGVCR